MTPPSSEVQVSSPALALDVRDLSVRLGGIMILRGISLAVPAGRVVGLVGRNGAGKTTTLRAIVTWAPADSASVRAR